MDARTAGDVLREELASGTEKRALARRLAGEGADYAAIERWRAVLTRVQHGAEPKPEQAKIVAIRFGVPVRQPDQSAQRARADRLRGVEEEMVQLRQALAEAGTAHDALVARVEALEGRGRGRRAGGANPQGPQPK